MLVRAEAQAEAGGDTTALELVLDRGLRLRIPRGVDGVRLRGVLAALSAQT